VACLAGRTSVAFAGLVGIRLDVDTGIFGDIRSNVGRRRIHLHIRGRVDIRLMCAIGLYVARRRWHLSHRTPGCH
jgi:hypothetical protein